MIFNDHDLSVAAKEQSISQLLSRRGAWLDGEGLPLAIARGRKPASLAIAEDFIGFETLRDQALGHSNIAGGRKVSRALESTLERSHIVEASGAVIVPTNADARRYLSGGWLEEYGGLAAEAAGADEVRIGQRVAWSVNGFKGVNEIDVIARFGTLLLFVSAKALRSRLESRDAKHRVALMSALNEADNLVDHFGDERSCVLLLVTTDLFDENASCERYGQLHGKATALGVSLATLEHLRWNALVDLMRKIVHTQGKAKNVVVCNLS